MTYNEANAKYSQKGRQLGDRIIYISSDGITETLHGYKITEFDRFDPKTLEFIKSVPMHNISTWEDAYDKLFGHPSGMPDIVNSIKL